MMRISERAQIIQNKLHKLNKSDSHLFITVVTSLCGSSDAIIDLQEM